MKLLGIDLVFGNDHYHHFNSKYKWFNNYFDIRISNDIVWYVLPLNGTYKDDNQLLIDMNHYFNEHISNLKYDSIDFIEACNDFNILFQRELLFI